MNDRRVPPGGAVLICVLLGAVLWVALASCALGRTVTHDTGGSVSARLTDPERIGAAETPKTPPPPHHSH